MSKKFEELGLNEKLIKALNENKFDSPFPIQETCIPLINDGKDIIGQSHTGSGKTAAYSLPLLNKIRSNGPLQGLILVPTRELAVQVTNEINKFSKYTGIRTTSIYGGQNIRIQYDQLKRGSQIVVATPGRLIDHLKHGSISLESVKYVVLDEADRMLDMGFIEDIKFILFYVSEDRQTHLFSATMPPEILRLSQEYMKDVQHIKLNEEDISLDTIEQSYLLINENEKFGLLCNLIKKNENNQMIIFSATKQRTQRIAFDLSREGFRAITIHGDLTQKQRDNSMFKFRKGIENILVATDIAARGIDVPAVGYVINYDIPEDPFTYFHRIGRTARAGGKGKAISLVARDRMQDFQRIMGHTEQPIRMLNDELGITVPPVRNSYTKDHYNHRRFNFNNRNNSQQRYSNSNNRNYHGKRTYKERNSQQEGSSRFYKTRRSFQN